VLKYLYSETWLFSIRNGADNSSEELAVSNLSAVVAVTLAGERQDWQHECERGFSGSPCGWLVSVSVAKVGFSIGKLGTLLVGQVEFFFSLIKPCSQ
jgi:hypothetical protein